MLNKNLLVAKMYEAGYTQKDLSRRVGLSQNTISSRLNGQSQFDLAEVDQICEALGIRDEMEKAKIFLSSSSQ